MNQTFSYESLTFLISIIVLLSNFFRQYLVLLQIFSKLNNCLLMDMTCNGGKREINLNQIITLLSPFCICYLIFQKDSSNHLAFFFIFAILGTMKRKQKSMVLSTLPYIGLELLIMSL